MKQFEISTQKVDPTRNYDFTCHTVSEGIDHNASKKQTGTWSCFLGYRHLAAFWCFFYYASVNMHLSVVSVAIVAMVNHTAVTMGDQTNTSADSCPLLATAPNASEELKADGPFSWDSQIQGQILGLSSVGYITASVFSGRVAETLGAKRVLLLADAFLNAFSLLSPFAAEWHVNALIVFQGARAFSQGFIMPCIFVMMANWFPRTERGILSSFVSCGLSSGPLLATLGAGKLCDIPALGWKSAFFAFSGLNIVASIIFAFVFYEVPKIHPYISKEELLLITQDQENDMSLKRPPAPWKEISSSIPVHALSIGKFGYYWSLTHFFSMHPTFMGTVLHFSMTQNGFLTSMLFLLMLVGSIISMIVSHWQRRKKCCSLNALRKGFSSISALGFSICLVGVLLSGCNATSKVVFCGFATLFAGFGVGGTPLASVDMSPTFSGTVMGLTTFVGSMAQILMPIVTGALTKQETLEEWHVVFYIHISIILICALIFQIFGSANIQPWDSVQSQETKNTTEHQPQAVPTQNESKLPTAIHM